MAESPLGRVFFSLPRPVGDLAGRWWQEGAEQGFKRGTSSQGAAWKASRPRADAKRKGVFWSGGSCSPCRVTVDVVTQCSGGWGWSGQAVGGNDDNDDVDNKNYNDNKS